MINKITISILTLCFVLNYCPIANLAAEDEPEEQLAYPPSGESTGAPEQAPVVNEAPNAAPEEQPAPIQPAQTGEQVPGCVTVNFKDADIRAVLSYLSDVGGVDIVPSPDVTGTITLKLTNKPWQTALDIIVRNYGFAYEKDGDIIRVVTLDSINMQELETEVIQLNYAKCADIIESVKDMLSERGKISSDARTNYIVITDVPTSIDKIKNIISKLDQKTPQILIEAEIVETQLGEKENMGIDWYLRFSAYGAARPTTAPFDAFQADWGLGSGIIPKFFPVGTTGTSSTTVGSGGATETTTPGDFPTGNNVLADAATYAFPFTQTDDFKFGSLDFSQFGLIMEYLKRRDNTKVISNPKITTLNNKEAKIFVGKIFYYITKVKEDDQTGKTTYEYSEKEVGIRLLVTPNVNESGEIVVKLKPEIKQAKGEQVLVEGVKMPNFETREAETEVMIKDGDTIFIGGLIKEDVIKSEKKFPVFGDLVGDMPLVGPVFKYKQDETIRSELIFFITVRIVNIESRRSIVDMRGAKPFEAKVPMGQDIVNNTPPVLEKPKTVEKDKKSKNTGIFPFNLFESNSASAKSKRKPKLKKLDE